MLFCAHVSSLLFWSVICIFCLSCEPQSPLGLAAILIILVSFCSRLVQRTFLLRYGHNTLACLRVPARDYESSFWTIHCVLENRSLRMLTALPPRSAQGSSARYRSRIARDDFSGPVSWIPTSDHHDSTVLFSSLLVTRAEDRRGCLTSPACRADELQPLKPPARLGVAQDSVSEWPPR